MMGVPEGVKNAEGDDWYVDGSDDEKYDPSKSGSGIWQPDPQDILSMFDKLQTDKVLELQWKCPGRRAPKSEEDTQVEGTMDAPKEEDTLQEEEKPHVAPTEFDFDEEEGPAEESFSYRRTPGSKTPKPQKKRATMDKVLQDMMIQNRQKAAEKEARRIAGRSPRTPSGQGRARPLGTPPRNMSPGSSPLQQRHMLSPGVGMTTPPGQIRSGAVTTPVRLPHAHQTTPVSNKQSNNTPVTSEASNHISDIIDAVARESHTVETSDNIQDCPSVLQQPSADVSMEPKTIPVSKEATDGNT